MVLRLEAPHVVEQLSISEHTRALGPRSPRIESARRDVEHAAHEAHREGADMLLDKAKSYLGTSAKMPIAAFLRPANPAGQPQKGLKLPGGAGNLPRIARE